MSLFETESVFSDFTFSTTQEIKEPNSNDGINPGPSVRPNGRFFLSDDYVTLRVENELFRVPGIVLKKHSPKFQNLDVSSSSHGEVIELEDLEALDFERMLSLLLPSSLDSHDLQTSDEWVSVLKVAHTCDFPVARSLAIKKLEQIAIPVDKVVLGHQYGIPGWILSGYMELIVQKQPLTKVEASKLGVDDILELAELREWWNRIDDDVKRKDLMAKVQNHISESPPANAGRLVEAFRTRGIVPDVIVSSKAVPTVTVTNNDAPILPDAIEKRLVKFATPLTTFGNAANGNIGFLPSDLHNAFVISLDAGSARPGTFRTATPIAPLVQSATKQIEEKKHTPTPAVATTKTKEPKKQPTPAIETKKKGKEPKKQPIPAVETTKKKKSKKQKLPQVP